ncbi:OLC1v1008339C1 [Oldenlandia corymbosa var. corymbosa]|uniref:OLC1v1008339C1 n=1 Tax=Oldenlandia corymbosa var. corymbosa TaxID=529605 RepID=A0AAV1DPR1_OLDCO|nr:OLC1v1008339C1 [Oldenlandia corymbosa var. corymbosa]
MASLQPFPLNLFWKWQFDNVCASNIPFGIIWVDRMLSFSDLAREICAIAKLDRNRVNLNILMVYAEQNIRKGPFVVQDDNSIRMVYNYSVYYPKLFIEVKNVHVLHHGSTSEHHLEPRPSGWEHNECENEDFEDCADNVESDKEPDPANVSDSNTSDTDASDSDESDSDASDTPVTEETGQFIFSDTGDLDPDLGRDPSAPVLWDENLDKIGAGTCFRSKKEVKSAITKWSLRKGVNFCKKEMRGRVWAVKCVTLDPKYPAKRRHDTTSQWSMQAVQKVERIIAKYPGSICHRYCMGGEGSSSTSYTRLSIGGHDGGLEANHPVTPLADTQGQPPSVTIANLGSYNSKEESKTLPKIPQDWYMVKRNLVSGSRKIAEACSGSSICEPNFLYVKAPEKYCVAWNYREAEGFEAVKDEWTKEDEEKNKEFASDLEKLERYPKILGYGVVQQFIPVMPIEGLQADNIIGVPFREKEDDNTSITKSVLEKIKRKKKKRAVARESEKGPTTKKSKTHTSPDKEIEAKKQTKETIPPTTEKEAPSEKETRPSTRPSCVEKEKSPVEGTVTNVTILPPKIPAGGLAVTVYTFDNPPTIECPVLEEFTASLTEEDRLKLMSTIMMNHAKKSRDLRRELAEPQANRDQAVTEKRVLDERNHQLQAKEAELASVKTQLGELKQKFQEYCDLHISKEYLTKWCTAFWWRMLSSGGMTTAVEEINIASMAYGGHAVTVEGLKRLKSKKPIKAKWLKQFLKENPTKTIGPCEELAIPEVSEEDFGIDLEEDEDEAAEEDDTCNSGAKDQDPPTVGDTGGAEEGNPLSEGSSGDQTGNDSRSQTAENAQLKRRERIKVFPWFLKKFHILSLVEKQIQIRTERFIAAIEMLKKRTKEAEFYSRQSAVLQNVLVDREIPLPILEGLDEHAEARERTAAEEFLLRIDEQDWEIFDLKDKLNQCIDLLRKRGFSIPQGEDRNI